MIDYAAIAAQAEAQKNAPCSFCTTVAAVGACICAKYCGKDICSHNPYTGYDSGWRNVRVPKFQPQPCWLESCTCRGSEEHV